MKRRIVMKKKILLIFISIYNSAFLITKFYSQVKSGVLS